MVDGDEKKFDGIVIPLHFRNLGNTDNNLIGEIAGISLRELRFGPDELQINYAIPKRDGFDLGFFWLDNCIKNPSDPYSIRACYNWLLPYFSDLAETERTAIRVKSTTNAHPRWVNYDFIFWHKGKPVPVGQQYVYGGDSLRLLKPGVTLLGAIEKWEDKEYDIIFQNSLRILKEANDSVLSDVPMIKLNLAEQKLKTEARDAGWPQKSALMSRVV